MHIHEIGPKVVGIKQTLRALKKNHVTRIFVAEDADPFLIDKVISLARAKKVQVVYVATMKELGQACRINVGTATAALIKK